MFNKLLLIFTVFVVGCTSSNRLKTKKYVEVPLQIKIKKADDYVVNGQLLSSMKLDNNSSKLAIDDQYITVPVVFDIRTGVPVYASYSIVFFNFNNYFGMRN